MRAHRSVVLVTWVLAAAWAPAAAEAQEEAQRVVSCRDRPCSILIDWARAGGFSNQVPDRRYGNPTDLEQRIKARLTERGFANLGAPEGQGLRILLVPHTGRAMCDEVAGTTTDMSCNAVLEIETRLEGSDELRKGVDLPSRIRNRCASEKVMPVDQFATFLSGWIIYALDGKASGERRPVARC